MSVALIMGILALYALSRPRNPVSHASLGGEQMTDFRNLNISLLTLDPKVTITNIEAPTQLKAGEVPKITVTVQHQDMAGRDMWARIRDVKTQQLVTSHKTKYIYWNPETFTFQGLAPRGDWGAVMPNKTWYLVVEVGYSWLI